MKELAICLDVGGTFIKGAIFSDSFKEKYTDIHYYPANSESSKEEIMKNFEYIFFDLLEPYGEQEWLVEKIAIAFPGPFDYKNGISLIKDLNKFNQLYRVNLAEEFKTIIEADKRFSMTDIFFENDAVAFAFGENDFSKVRKGAYFTVGTGLGSTFINKKQQVMDDYGIPHSGMIFNESFHESIIDDYVSARGLASLIDEKYFEKISGSELFAQAEAGSQDARKVFKKFGENLCEAIKPYVLEFEPEEICFGGQISKSFKYFGQEIEKQFSENCVIRVSKDTTLRTLEGLFIIKNGEEKDYEKVQ
ncbi:ROK family protein [Enterococcus asini]|uniref:ROK family protein n=1 Tax=Enterococcus asini TaxID=57732 RepID=UPI00288CE23B|nr:ROK family protein [Enterococcus asini]MDT2763723.1 ROK family protein [Enterococcus asini]